MVNTRPVSSVLARNYVQKAQECLESGRDAFQKSHWNSSIIASIHVGICAADALTVFFLGKRCAGERHIEVITLMKEITPLYNTDTSKKIHQLSLILDYKNRAEYEEYLMSSADAEALLKAAERFLNWVQEAVKYK